MSDYGIFEASATDGHEEEQRQRQATRDLGTAIESAREGFGDFLSGATDKQDYSDRLALIMNDLMQKVADSGVMPVPGVMRKVKAALRPEFRQAANEEALEWAENYFQKRGGDKSDDPAQLWKDALGLSAGEFGTNFSAEDYARHSSRKKAYNDGDAAEAAAAWAESLGYNDPWGFASWLVGKGYRHPMSDSEYQQHLQEFQAEDDPGVYGSRKQAASWKEVNPRSEGIHPDNAVWKIQGPNGLSGTVVDEFKSGTDSDWFIFGPNGPVLNRKYGEPPLTVDEAKKLVEDHINSGTLASRKQASAVDDLKSYVESKGVATTQKDKGFTFPTADGAKGHVYENRAGEIVVQTLIGGSGGVQSNYTQDEVDLVKEWVDRTASIKTADSDTDARWFFQSLKGQGYTMPKDAGRPGDGGDFDDFLDAYANREGISADELRSFLTDNWDEYAYGHPKDLARERLLGGSRKALVSASSKLSSASELAERAADDYEEDTGNDVFISPDFLSQYLPAWASANARNISYEELKAAAEMEGFGGHTASRKQAFSEQLGVHLTEVFESGEAGGGWRPITGERLDWEKGDLEFYGGSGFFRDYSDGDDGEDADVFTFSTDDDAVIIDAAWKAVDYANGNLASRKQASDIDLDDMGVLNFFYQFEDEGLEPSAPGDEQWEWLKNNVDYDILQDKIDLAYEHGEIGRGDADSMAYDLQQTFFGSRKVALDWSSVQDKVQLSGWDPMYADYIAWALDNDKDVTDTYSFVDYSDLMGLDAEEEQLLKKFIQNTAPRLYGSRKTADLSSTLSDENYDVSSFFWDTFGHHSGLDTDIPNAEQWTWIKENVSREEIVEGINDILALGGYITQADADALLGDLGITASRKQASDASYEGWTARIIYDEDDFEYAETTTPSGEQADSIYPMDGSHFKGGELREALEELAREWGDDAYSGTYQYNSSRKTAGLEWDTEEMNYWSYTSPDSGLDYWIKKDPADYNNYYGGFAWSVFDYLAGAGDRGNAQSFDEAEQSIENFIDSQSPNAALDYLGSRKQARDTWDDWVNRMEDEEAAGTGYGSTPGWHVDLPNESPGDEDIDNPDSENPGRFSRRKTALDIDGSWEEELLGIGYASCTPKAGGGFELYMWSDSKQSEALDVVGTSEEARRIWKEWRGSDTPPAGNAFNTDDNYFL